MSLCEKQLKRLESNLNIDEIKKDFANVTMERKQEKNVNNDHSSDSKMTKVMRFKQTLAFSDYKWLLQAYGVIASFYNSVGNQEKCEASYVKYIKLIERFYHQDSLEASNAYFLVGVYYFEESMTHKSIACFRKALALR